MRVNSGRDSRDEEKPACVIRVANTRILRRERFLRFEFSITYLESARPFLPTPLASTTIGNTETFFRLIPAGSEIKRPWPPDFLGRPGPEVNQFLTRLENKLHSQLEIAGVPGTINFPVSNLGAGLAKANGSAATSVDGIPLGMVERVKRFSPELQSGAL